MSAAKKPSSRRSRTPKKTARKATSKKTTTRKAAGAAKKKTAKKTTQKKAAGAAKKKATAAKSKSAPKKPAKKEAQKKVAARKPLISPPPPVPRRSTRPMKLDPQTLADIRKRLEAEQADLQRQEEELEHESFDATQSDMTGEVGLDEDFADAGAATFDRERDLSILNNIKDLKDQITRAIRRIDEGTYGTCERCGRPIDAARLRALPHASLCMDCKRREERMR
ncbi:MAG: TraR/DksA family transcriptional regulator [Actinomycetota bacterium]